MTPTCRIGKTDAGIRVLLAEGPSDPDPDWLERHRWVWNRTRMEEVLSQHNGPTFVCGIALNIGQLRDLFTRIFLLRIDEATQESRLLAHDQNNQPGRTEPQREQIRRGRSTFEAQILSMGAVTLDGTAAPSVIAEELVALVAVDT